MKAVTILLAVFLIFMGTAVAKPQTVDLGPYKVSFDLGKVCSAVADKPTESESLTGVLTTTYTLLIRSKKDEGAYISIIKLNNAYIPNSYPIDSLKKEVEDFFKGMGLAVYDTGYREIDGTQGVVGQAQDPRYVGSIYIAEYVLNNQTQVKLMSFYPLNEGTLNLIKTIHVELANETIG